MIAEAFADSPIPGEGPRWLVPSLATLKAQSEKSRQGFTEFNVVGRATPSLKTAQYFTYAIVVNGVPILIDGWDPHYIRIPYDHEKGLDFSFALENLDFSGRHNGREQLELTLRFWGEGLLIRELKLERQYVALRDARMEKFNIDGMGEIRWSGKFNNRRMADKFEVFLMSSQDMSTLQDFKWKLDSKNLMYQDNRVTAVIRPPLNNNPNSGITFGVIKDTGQTQFTFDEQSAAEVCRWLLIHRRDEKHKNLYRDDIFRFENEPLTSGSPKVTFCRDLGKSN
jgi:hypothetical protein